MTLASKYDGQRQNVSWACSRCGKSGIVSLLRHEAAHRTLVDKAVADKHQSVSPLCLSKQVGVSKFACITLLPARNGLPRWWHAQDKHTKRALDLDKPEDVAAFKVRGEIVALTCRFHDELTGITREETLTEAIQNMHSTPWPPWERGRQ